MNIKILGPGCPKCQQTEKVVREVVTESGADAQVEKVTDIVQIAEYGVFGTPAVVIDGEVKSVGKIPSAEEIKAWLKP
ncbi:MAG: thioredoxin family protein [Thermodesulfobacteriota bacterium]|nr:thioredoxin family protein [Thermodesulfobacteriota bacterium]